MLGLSRRLESLAYHYCVSFTNDRDDIFCVTVTSNLCLNCFRNSHPVHCVISSKKLVFIVEFELRRCVLHTDGRPAHVESSFETLIYSRR